MSFLLCFLNFFFLPLLHSFLNAVVVVIVALFLLLLRVVLLVLLVLVLDLRGFFSSSFLLSSSL